MKSRGLTRQREGIVTANRMEKTVVVTVERIVLHPRYKKYLRRRTKVKAHDERNECEVGDRVLISESQPLSREKRWRVSRILHRVEGAQDVGPAENEAAEVL